MLDNPYVTLVLHFVNLFAAMLVAGGQVYVFMVIIPTKRAFATRVSVEVHNAMLGHQTDIYMKPSGIVSILSAALILVLGLVYARLPTASLVCLVIGMYGTLGVVVCSRYFNVPTNAMMLTWSLDNIPPDYPEVRRTWDRVHTIRACHGVLGFTGYLLAALIRIVAGMTVMS